MEAHFVLSFLRIISFPPPLFHYCWLQPLFQGLAHKCPNWTYFLTKSPFFVFTKLLYSRRRLTYSILHSFKVILTDESIWWVIWTSEQIRLALQVSYLCFKRDLGRERLNTRATIAYILISPRVNSPNCASVIIHHMPFYSTKCPSLDINLNGHPLPKNASNDGCFGYNGELLWERRLSYSGFLKIII